MEHCNNCNHNCSGNNIYVSGSETRTAIDVANNKSRYYAELAEGYKNEAKNFRDSAQYYAEQNTNVSISYVNELEGTLRTLIGTKQAAGDYALNSSIPTKVSDLTNDSNFATVSQIPTNNNQLTNGAGYITGISSSDVTTALGYTPANSSFSNLSLPADTTFGTVTLENCNIRTVVKTYTNGASWYRIYSDKFCIQGSTFTGSFNQTSEHSLLKTFADTNYTIVGNANNSSDNSLTWAYKTKATNKFTGEASRSSSGNQTYTKLSWFAFGYVSSIT